MSNSKEFPIYLNGEQKTTTEFNHLEYQLIIDGVRTRMNKSLLHYNDSFNREYVSNSPDNIAKTFSFNGATKIPQNIDQQKLSLFEQKIISENSLFAKFRDSFYSRSHIFYNYEIQPKQENESVYFLNLVNKIIFIHNQLANYQNELKNNLNIDFIQWQILFTLIDNYNLVISQLFNTVSYLKVMRNKNVDLELSAIKNYYYDLTVSINNLIAGNKVEDIPKLDLDFQNIFQNLDISTQKDIDKEIVRGVFEANNILFNGIWSNTLSQEISEKITDKNQEIFVVGMHFGAIQLPFLLKSKLKKLGYSNIKTVSCHFSTKNEYTHYDNLFDISIDEIKDKQIILVDDSISSGKSISTMYNFLKYKSKKEPIISTVNIEKIEGTSYERGVMETSFLKKITSITRISPVVRFRSIEERNKKRKKGSFHLSRQFANKILYNNPNQ